MSLPTLWSALTLDVADEILGREKTDSIIAGLELPEHRRDDPMRQNLELDTFGDLQQAFQRAVGVRQAAAILEAAGERLHSVQFGEQRPPGLLGIFQVAGQDAFDLRYYADFWESVTDQQVSIEEAPNALLWRLYPYPLLTPALRGRFEMGFLRAASRREVRVLGKQELALVIEIAR